MDQRSHPPESTAVRARDAALDRLRRVNLLIAGGAVALTGAFVALAAAAPSRKTSSNGRTPTATSPSQGQGIDPSSGGSFDNGSGQGFDDGSGSDQGFGDGGLTPPSQVPSGSSQVPVAPSGGS
jgi:hypothetical protein